MIRSGAAHNILFIAADIFTHYINWNDRNTCVLFGDGAGAVVLQPTEEPYGQLSCVLGASGKDEDLMAVDVGGTRLPAKFSFSFGVITTRRSNFRWAHERLIADNVILPI